jgi:hypothetical protein
LAITEPFHEFSLSQWNLGYQGAFPRTFIFHDGTRLSRSLFTQWSSQNARIGGRIFSYILQRVFTQDQPR